MTEHTLGDKLCYPDGILAVSKLNKTFYMAEGYVTKAGITSCRGCCFGPHSKCKNGYNLCIKHHGEKYRSWIYKEAMKCEK